VRESFRIIWRLANDLLDKEFVLNDYIFFGFLFLVKIAPIFKTMEFELNTMQLVGICLLVTGLILNTVIFSFSYYKIVAYLKEKEGHQEAEKKSFPLIRFAFRFRNFLKELNNGEKKESYILIVAFLKWAIFLALAMILIGLLLFLFGFLL
jgi:hypothetical protein